MKTFQEIRARFEVLTHSQCWSKHTAANDFTNSYVQWLEDEIIRFDQQNKELRERADELAIELHETIIKHDELFDEAERLTKEVELLKRESDIAFKKVNDKKAEITRLRELLYKTMPHVQTCEGSESKLLTEIDNALNHKP